MAKLKSTKWRGIFFHWQKFVAAMDKLQLTGQNLGRVFNFRTGHLNAADLGCYWVKLPNLNLKTQPKQLLDSLPRDIVLPVATKTFHAG